MVIHFQASQQKFKIHHLEIVSLHINSQNKMDTNKIQDLCNQDKALKSVMEATIKPRKMTSTNTTNSLK